MSGEGDDPNLCDACMSYACDRETPCPARYRTDRQVAEAPEEAIFALAIPTCADWLPARAESLAHLLDQLGSRPTFYREFRERESNRVWPTRLWRWAVETGATHLVQVQDDVIPSPRFWSILRAMVDAQPTRIIGLHANHPLAPVQFRAGRRWYRDRWLTGPAYVFPLRANKGPHHAWSLPAFLGWCNERSDLVASTNEDSLICKWAEENQIDIWHPVPTITDVDQGVPSTYANDGHHEWSMYRRPLVTWRDAVSIDAMTDPRWWACTEAAAPLLPGPGTQLCWFCAERPTSWTSGKTGARMCKACYGDITSNMLGRVP